MYSVINNFDNHSNNFEIMYLFAFIVKNSYVLVTNLIINNYDINIENIVNNNLI